MRTMFLLWKDNKIYFPLLFFLGWIFDMCPISTAVCVERWANWRVYITLYKNRVEKS